MPALRHPPQAWLEAIRRALARTDRWLDDPRVEFSAYLALILLSPLIRLGVEQIGRLIGL
jgi:hypothetical protein